MLSRIVWAMALTASLVAGAAVNVLVTVAPASAAGPARHAISQEASAALLRMGQTLRAAEQFSFRANTIRVYSEANGEPLHIWHTVKITVHRPNRLLAETSGDDGAARLVFDGKTLVLFSAVDKKYVRIPIPEGTIEGMLKEAVDRIGVDFPLADFLSDAPNKALLTGVTAGRVVNTVTIDGAPYLHMFFSQPPGIEFELWLAKNEQSLPRRVIVTYRSLPGQPNFIAEFGDWDFNIHPSDADFIFQPPADAVQMAFKPVAATSPAKAKGGKK
jgi:hypothetical protein